MVFGIWQIKSKDVVINPIREIRMTTSYSAGDLNFILIIINSLSLVSSFKDEASFS